MRGENQDRGYRARRKYRDAGVAQAYDLTRFSGPLGRIKLWRDHRLLSRALREVGRVRWVLDLPSGTGRFSPVLEKRAERVVSADISLEMMAVAAQRHPSPRVLYIQCSVEGLPFRDACFDLTFTARFLLHLPPALRQVALCELARVSKRWVLFDCMMEGGLKGWARKFGGSGRAQGKAKKRMGREELMELLRGSDLQICHIFRPSRFFSEKWMILCQKKQSAQG
ncbi:MAG: class I SAM-dependent methyltransferase [candidate division NC10 bacterium]|nr:class I SAM-dependent methyltransferase [candidate division NC10 bacterium]